jgi:hypothetical protein
MSILCFRPSSLVALMATYRLYARRTRVRIPIQSGRVYRFEAGRDSDLKPATVPK